MALAIGFATEYFTLWDICSEDNYNSQGFKTHTKYHYWYQKNISKDIEKVKALYPGIEIDEELRGHSRSFERTERVEYPVECFSFGMNAGFKISEATDIWQLRRALHEEKGPRRRALARRRLIELGELVRYSHFETRTVYGPDGDQVIEVRQNYATPRFAEIEEAKKKQAAQPFLFADGQKVELSIKQVGQFGFNTNYGFTFVRIYETSEGQTVKYVGGSPIDLNEGFNKVKATVKHKEFRGNKETHLLRMKIAG